MFRKKYKEFIDQTEPNRELINKIFEKTETENKQLTKSKLYKFTARYGAALAAVFILSVSAVIYTQLNYSDKKLIVQKESNDEEIMLENEFDAEEVDITAGQEDNVKHGETNDLTKEETVQNQPSEHYAYTEKNRTTPVEPDLSEIKENKASFLNLENSSEVENQLIYSVLKDYLGEKDLETGNQQIYEIVGKFNAEGEQYYLGRWRWLVNNDHSSLLCEFVLKGNLSEMYECIIENDYITWTNENNFLKN